MRSQTEAHRCRRPEASVGDVSRRSVLGSESDLRFLDLGSDDLRWSNELGKPMVIVPGPQPQSRTFIPGFELR